MLREAPSQAASQQAAASTHQNLSSHPISPAKSDSLSQTMIQRPERWQASGGMAGAANSRQNALSSTQIAVDASLPPLPGGPAHTHSSSSGGSSDQASPRFLELLRNSLPRQEEDEQEGGSGSADGSSGPSTARQQPADLPSTLAMLHALNGSAPPHNVLQQSDAETALNGHAAGKRQKRSLLSMFRSKDKQGKHAGAGAPAPGNDGSSGSSKGSGDSWSKKKSSASSWFSSSKMHGELTPAASPRPPLPPQLPQPPAAVAELGAVPEGGVMLPGLPLEIKAANASGEGTPAEVSPLLAHAPLLPTPESIANSMVADVPASASASEAPSAPSSAHPSPAVGGLGVPQGGDAGVQDKKGSHRRHRSLTSMLVPGWRRRSRHSAGSESELGGDVTPTRAGSLEPSRAPSPALKGLDVLGVWRDRELLSSPSAPPAFEVPLPLLPPGTTGLRNIGNTCFINAALQCLRYTPGLPLQVAPDLLQRAQQAEGSAGASGDAAAAAPEPEPASAEDVHAQALARASVEVRAPKAAVAAEQAAAVDSQEQQSQLKEPEAGQGSAEVSRHGMQEGSAAAEAPNSAADRSSGATDIDSPAALASEASAIAPSAENAPPTGEADQKAGQLADQGSHSAEPVSQAVPATESPVGATEAAPATPPPASMAPAPATSPAQSARPPLPARPPPPARPPKGALLQAFAELITELYVPAGSDNAAVCATPLLRTLRAFPIAADYFDGGQHDCQEVLRVVMDLLHEEMNRAPPRSSSGGTAQPPSTEERQAVTAPSSSAAGTEAPSLALPEIGAMVDAKATHSAGLEAGAQQANEVASSPLANGADESQTKGVDGAPAASSQPNAVDSGVPDGRLHKAQVQTGIPLCKEPAEPSLRWGMGEGPVSAQQQGEHAAEDATADSQAGKAVAHDLTGCKAAEQPPRASQPASQDVEQPIVEHEGHEHSQQAQQPVGEGAPPQVEQEDEAAKAERAWRQYLERDSSVITDLFGGQLQSSVTCHKCGGRFTMYEPFWDLSLPLAKEAKGGTFSWLGLKGSTPASIQDCLTAFTADERLEGAEAFHCERCKDKTPATKHLRVHRFPDVLVLHIKRFKYKGASTDKLTTNVSFPLKGLRLAAYASPECAATPEECCYDLFAVSNHYGNLSGGHYTAMCRVPQRGGGDAWYSFNDEQVTRVPPSQVVSQYAYILFYVRSPASAAAAGARHRRTASASSAGAAGHDGA